MRYRDNQRAARALLVPIVRFWPASMLLLICVALAAVVQFQTAPRHYTVTQELRVVVLTSPSSAPNADTEADQVAREICDPAVLSSPRLATSVLARMQPDTIAGEHMSADTLQGALAAIRSGATVELSATWTSPTGATQIVGAVLNALQTDSSVLSDTVAIGEAVRLQATSPVSTAVRSADEAAAMRETLVVRIAMGVVAALLLPFVLDALLSERTLSLRGATARA